MKYVCGAVKFLSVIVASLMASGCITLVALNSRPSVQVLKTGDPNMQNDVSGGSRMSPMTPEIANKLLGVKTPEAPRTVPVQDRPAE